MTDLLGVQQAALNAAKGKSGFAYFMEMGLGKTLTALTEFLGLVKQKEATRLVVVCPNSFKNGWRAEIIKHNLPIEPIVYTSGDGMITQVFNEKPPCLIVNYEAIRSPNTQMIIKQFVLNKNAMIVFDESIQIKTYDSAQTKAAIQIAKEFKYSRVLSGKPITQGPHDLWGQMRAIGQINGLNYFIFRNSFCKMGGFKGKQVVGAINEERLGDLINPHVFRAKKDDWIDLPPKIYTKRQYEMIGPQLIQYRTMEREFVTWLNDEENVTVDMALTKYVKLAQIQFGFIIDEERHIHELVKKTSNPRIIALKEIISTEVAGKVVVVYNHRYAGEVLFETLLEYQPAIIRGSMDGTEIAHQRDIFNENPKCRCILIQSVAGKYGHTLIGGIEPENRCSTVIFAENTWSLDTRSQLEDRIHRIGQQGNACVYIDLFGSELDERVINALQRKENVFQAVFRHIQSNH
jgi:SNF2 family DNA or RNA helicase